MTTENGRQLALDGKVAIVTGAARGIGRAIAGLLARSGVSVLLQDIDGKTLQKTCDRLQKQGRDVLQSQGDISRATDVQSMINRTIAAWGRVDILVNNAGIGGVGKSLLELEIEEWQRMIDVDLTGVFLSCQAILPHMIEQKHGYVPITGH